MTAPTSVVTLTVVDALPLAELEGLVEFRHVFCVDRLPVSGEVVHLDEDMSLRSRLTHHAEYTRVVARPSVAKVLNATHNRLPPGGWSIDKPLHGSVELDQGTLLGPGPVGERDATMGKTFVELALWPISEISVTLHER